MNADKPSDQDRIAELELELKPWRAFKWFSAVSLFVALLFGASCAVLKLDESLEWVGPTMRWWIKLVALLLRLLAVAFVVGTLFDFAPAIIRLPRLFLSMLRHPKQHTVEMFDVLVWAFWLAVLTYLFTRD